jgi:Uma2 family endonuclease
VALLRPRDYFYAERHPAPGDLLLVVGVSETSLEYDSSVKVPLYAKAGVPEAWVVDLAERGILAHAHPEDGRYAEVRRFGAEGTLSQRTLPELPVRTADVLGRSGP